MKLRGGYNLLLEGRPDLSIKVMPEVDSLALPLRSRRFTFDKICVGDGQNVRGGDVLAKDSNNYGVPLLAPRAGVVRLQKDSSHIVLENVAKLDERADMDKEEMDRVLLKFRSYGVQKD